MKKLYVIIIRHYVTDFSVDDIGWPRRKFDLDYSFVAPVGYETHEAAQALIDSMRHSDARRDLDTRARTGKHIDDYYTYAVEAVDIF